jgi:hypothetical protein
LTDIGLGEAVSVVTQNLGTRGDTFRRQRNIASNNHIALGGPIGDPHIGNVWSIRNNDDLNQWILRHAQTTIADKFHVDFVTRRDPLGLGFYRTGVGIDEQNCHA